MPSYAVWLGLVALLLVVAVVAIRTRRPTAVGTAPMRAADLIAALGEGRIEDAERELRNRIATAAVHEPVFFERIQLAELLLLKGEYWGASGVLYHGLPPRSLLWQSVIRFVGHEIDILRVRPGPPMLEAIRASRDECLRTVHPVARPQVELSWRALEGLCLARLGRDHEARAILPEAIDGSLHSSPARPIYLYHLGRVYERIGDTGHAVQQYDMVRATVPGTLWADGASERIGSLGA